MAPKLVVNLSAECVSGYLESYLKLLVSFPDCTGHQTVRVWRKQLVRGYCSRGPGICLLRGTIQFGTLPQGQVSTPLIPVVVVRPVCVKI